MTRLSVEEILRAVEAKAALLRFLASAAQTSEVPPDRNAMSGVEDVCAEIEELVGTVRHALSPDALGIEPRRVR